MKYCNTCSTEKPFSDFHKNKSKPDGHTCQCKSCVKAYQAKNISSIKSQQKEYRAANPEVSQKRQQRWYSANKISCLLRCKVYKKNNPHINRLTTQRQRAKRIKRSVEWADSELNNLVINEIYEKCEAINKITGVKHHVDHIIPLQGKKVSGLHHYTNMQILTGIQNSRKNNYYEV